MSVVEALATLRAAGWDVQERRSPGVLSAGILCARYDGTGRQYESFMAVEPWQPVKLEP